MKQLTKKQRNKIYRKAYILSVERYDEGVYICEAFSFSFPDIGWGSSYESDKYKEILPEFGFFDPYNDSRWFGSYRYDHNKNKRLTALAFMIAMTEDKQ